MTYSVPAASQTPLFVSFIDKEDRPLLVHAIGSTSPQIEIKYNVLSNLALDYFGELTNHNLSSPPSYLFEMHGVVVYGEYLSQKGLKIVIGFDVREDEGTLHFFQKVRLYYLKSVINPFNEDWINQVKKKLDKLQFD
ncbi:unnamed protein product [Kluyveromyces dobzhanskii CBS 2104]|uniref:WGS project CCBQ000000000 data, contig 00107 n=1 Tax=Kluyveromyces dobzhanskii CBS 2104 TaxID=1427455 RepID=A0A0A8L0M3_9SACH|nr:unnamed protein product [Kluyveromyces dobzhanskii CBS 2104]